MGDNDSERNTHTYTHVQIWQSTHRAHKLQRTPNQGWGGRHCQHLKKQKRVIQPKGLVSFFASLTPNPHQAHPPRSQCTKNGYHTCTSESKWAVSSYVQTDSSVCHHEHDRKWVSTQFTCGMSLKPCVLWHTQCGLGVKGAKAQNQLMQKKANPTTRSTCLFYVSVAANKLQSANGKVSGLLFASPVWPIGGEKRRCDLDLGPGPNRHNTPFLFQFRSLQIFTFPPKTDAPCVICEKQSKTPLSQTKNILVAKPLRVCSPSFFLVLLFFVDQELQFWIDVAGTESHLQGSTPTKDQLSYGDVELEHLSGGWDQLWCGVGTHLLHVFFVMSHARCLRGKEANLIRIFKDFPMPRGGDQPKDSQFWSVSVVAMVVSKVVAATYPLVPPNETHTRWLCKFA